MTDPIVAAAEGSSLFDLCLSRGVDYDDAPLSTARNARDRALRARPVGPSVEFVLVRRKENQVEGFRMPSSGPNPMRSRAHVGRGGGSFPSSLMCRESGVLGDAVIDTALDEEKRRQVAHGATVGVIRRGSQAGSLLAVHGARAIQPNGLEMVRVMSSHVGDAELHRSPARAAGSTSVARSGSRASTRCIT